MGEISGFICMGRLTEEQTLTGRRDRGPGSILSRLYDNWKIGNRLSGLRGRRCTTAPHRIARRNVNAVVKMPSEMRIRHAIRYALRTATPPMPDGMRRSLLSILNILRAAHEATLTYHRHFELNG